MTISVALVAAIGVFGLGLSLGAAILLGAILAPTDPVLASDVQVLQSSDRDRLRFSLTGEGGLNDGAARFERTRGLGVFDHGQGNAVLDRAARVAALGLDPHALAGAGEQAVDADVRRAADGLEDVLGFHVGSLGCRSMEAEFMQ